ncbi:AraC family transcriptional regulator [Spirosoma foliorum]|uniref:AraC family transcriptional regulator n=1 Tax=Spirosoma foliorum TaxID=2710596 RepID=A0A7G5H0H6_9BACT|nr:helix-turn-helix domain-containing protein [Spirosoma foliorum]QMW04618.1 AraC family transcriptional regulator [Spirosoma foliorum]
MLPFIKHHQGFEPPEELRDAIKDFWYARIDLEEQQSSFDVLPDGYAELIFHFGGPCSIVTSAGLQSLPSPFMMGLLNQPVRLHAEKEFECIGIKCYPWTVFDLLGLPSKKVGLHFFEHPIARLQATLNELVMSGKIEEAMTQVKHYFLKARIGIATDSMLYKAGTAMRQANGTMPVSGVAAAAHATVRTLERRFKQSSGYSVKDVSALMRFEQVRDQLWFNPEMSLAGLAHEVGYSDQAHLSREFKRYSGTSPAVFAREAKNHKQVMQADFVAFVQD